MVSVFRGESQFLRLRRKHKAFGCFMNRYKKAGLKIRPAFFNNRLQRLLLFLFCLRLRLCGLFSRGLARFALWLTGHLLHLLWLLCKFKTYHRNSKLSIEKLKPVKMYTLPNPSHQGRNKRDFANRSSRSQ